MSKQDVSMARAAIKTMSREERQALRQELTALLAVGKNVVELPDKGSDDIASLVNEVLNAQGFPFMPLDRLRGTESYRQNAAIVWAFVRLALPNGQRVEQLALLRLGVRMLADNIAQQGIPLTHAVLIRQLHRLPAVVDSNLPGYARQGLLQMVVRRREANGR